MKKSISTLYMEQYIGANMENAYETDFTNMPESMHPEVYFYDELPSINVKGYPVASDYMLPSGKSCSMSDYLKLSGAEKKSCRLRYYYLPCLHELYMGATGSGKTTGCIEPQLRAISSQKNKPHIFVTDPKGELFDRNAAHLHAMGYRTYVLNFKNTYRSNRWNPFIDLLDTLREIKSLENEHGKTRRGKVGSKLVKMAPDSAFGEQYYEFAGQAFPDRESMERAIELKRSDCRMMLSSYVSQLTLMFVRVDSVKDPTWQRGAQEQIKGLLYAMCEYLLDPLSGMTEDMFTLRTMINFFGVIKTCFARNSNPTTREKPDIYAHPLVKPLSADTKAMFTTVFACSPVTMLSYITTIESELSRWTKPHIYALTTGHDFDLFDEDTPFAVFLITRDYERSDFEIAGLFVDWLYRKLIEKAEKSASSKPSRTAHFLLDEFGNIPKIEAFENKIATARSRNIYFHLVLQSYAQLENVYTSAGAAIIKDNCNALIFLGSQNSMTKELFAKDCGTTTISAPLISQGDNNFSELRLQQVPLVPLSKLDLMTPGDIYCKRIYSPLIKARYIRSYVAAAHGDFPGFSPAKGLVDLTPIPSDSYNDEKFKLPCLFDPNVTEWTGRERRSFF